MLGCVQQKCRNAQPAQLVVVRTCQVLNHPLLLHLGCCRYPGLQATSSYRQLMTVGCCHQYTLSGYALAKSLGPGTQMCSDYFEAGGQQFRLEVYPAGNACVVPAAALAVQYSRS